MDDWLEWGPRWCEHVSGRYEPAQYDVDTGLIEPQKYVLNCNHCGDRTGPLTCTSGDIWRKISIYAIMHLHRDVLAESVGRPRK